jgi:hypothetical protein
MNANEAIRLRNVGPTLWSDMFNGVTYQCPPGGETIVSFEAVCLWLGHPDAVDLGPGKTYRTDELHRLRIKYGVLDVLVEDPLSGHNVKTMEPCCPLSQDTQWDRNKPKLEAFTINGERIVTVVDDPDGRELTPAATSMAEQEGLQVQLKAMQKQMEQMQAQLANATRADAAEANSGAIPDDDAPIQTAPPFTDPQSAPITVPGPADPDVTEDSPSRVRVSS